MVRPPIEEPSAARPRRLAFWRTEALRFTKARPENRNRWNAHLPRDFNAQCLFSAKGGGMYGLERALFFALVIALVVVGIVAIAPSIL